VPRAAEKATAKLRSEGARHGRRFSSTAPCGGLLNALNRYARRFESTPCDALSERVIALERKTS